MHRMLSTEIYMAMTFRSSQQRISLDLLRLSHCWTCQSQLIIIIIHTFDAIYKGG